MCKAVACSHVTINFTVYVIMCELLSPRMHDLVIGATGVTLLQCCLLFLFAEVCSLDGRDAGGV